MANNENILAVGINILTEEEKNTVYNLLDKYHKKIQRNFDNPVFIDFHVKEYNRDGKKKKFSLHVRLHGATGDLESDYSDWDLSKTSHKVMEKMYNELKHKFYFNGKKKF